MKRRSWSSVKRATRRRLAARARPAAWFRSTHDSAPRGTSTAPSRRESNRRPRAGSPIPPGRRVERRQAEQHAFEMTRQRSCTDDADHDACGGQRQALTQHQADHLKVSGAERHADAAAGRAPHQGRPASASQIPTSASKQSEFTLYRLPIDYPVAPAFHPPNQPRPVAVWRDADNGKMAGTDIPAGTKPRCTGHHPDPQRRAGCGALPTPVRS